jgi:N-carbamoylputrescine amidase
MKQPILNNTMHGKPFSVSHSVANAVHVVSVNRVGLEQNGAMKFWGGSFVSNPFGSLIYKASHDSEEVAVVEIDTDKTDSYQNTLAFYA